MHPSTLLSLIFLTTFCNCKPFRTHDSALVVHEIAVSPLPTGWKHHSAADSDDILNLRIALSQDDQKFLDIAYEVNNPESEQYGKHLSAEELQALLPDFKPASDAVESWLFSNGIRDSSRNEEWISFNTTVAGARTLLHADFAIYSYEGGETCVRTTSYNVPANLSDKIDFIYPIIQFMRPQKRLQKRDTAIMKSEVNAVVKVASVSPSTLKSRYNINYQPKDKKSNSRLAVAGFLEQYPDTSDLHSFLKEYGLRKDTPAYNLAVQSISGGKNPNSLASSTSEAMLDLEYTTAFLDPLQVTYYTIGGRPPSQSQPNNKPSPTSDSTNEPYLSLLDYLLALESPPQVLSISYSDDEETVPQAYAQKVCTSFAKLAARGVSVLVASGDAGASGTGSSDCRGPDAKPRFIPTFPASCPWVTAVGATTASHTAAAFSAGGVSNYFLRESWQDAAVKAYLKQIGTSHKGWYNGSGRGTPDVSVLGEEFLVTTHGLTSTHDGTSASTPVFAGMIALLNDIRLREGKAVLGFLNPLLYSGKLDKAFRDVVGGQSVGCTGQEGWKAEKGWDPVSGIGEMDFGKVREFVT